MINNFPEEDPIFPRNLPPFDPKAAGPRLGASQSFGSYRYPPWWGAEGKPSSWVGKNMPDPSPFHSDMYPKGMYPERDFLHQPRFTLTDEDILSIMSDVNKAGLTDKMQSFGLDNYNKTKTYFSGQEPGKEAFLNFQKRFDEGAKFAARWSRNGLKDFTEKEIDEFLKSSGLTKSQLDDLEIKRIAASDPMQWFDDAFKTFAEAGKKKDNEVLGRAIKSAMSPQNLQTNEESKPLFNEYVSPEESKPVAPKKPDMSLRARAGRGMDYTTRGMSTPRGAGLVALATSLPAGSQIAGEELAKFEQAAGRQATTAERAAIMTGGLGTAILDGATFGLYEGITRGREYSPNIAWLMEKALPGSTSGWGPKR